MAMEGGSLGSPYSPPDVRVMQDSTTIENLFPRAFMASSRADQQRIAHLTLVPQKLAADGDVVQTVG